MIRTLVVRKNDRRNALTCSLMALEGNTVTREAVFFFFENREKPPDRSDSKRSERKLLLRQGPFTNFTNMKQHARDTHTYMYICEKKNNEQNEQDTGEKRNLEINRTDGRRRSSRDAEGDGRVSQQHDTVDTVPTTTGGGCR